MKKLLSLLLFFALLVGALSAFSVVFASDTPYSGGSGTEDDPYLISTSDDIKELYDNIEADPDLWLTKYYYKLTNDITTPYSISPLYYDKYYHSFKETNSDEGLIYEKYELWQSFRDYYDEEDIKIGVTFNPSGEIRKDHPDWINSSFSGSDLFTDSIFEYYKYAGKHRSVAFTGEFDGNGHTITLTSDKFLFGTLEREAVVKNLTIKGANASLVYGIDKNCTVKNIIVDVEAPVIYSNFINYNYGTIAKITNKCPEVGAGSKLFVKNHNGSIKDCLDLGGGSAFSFRVNSYSEVKRCVSLVEATPVSNSDGYYTLEECVEQGGDPLNYITFNFESVWIMRDGLPYLRHNLTEEADEDIEINDGMVFIFDKETKTATLTGFESDADISNLVIPSERYGYTVTDMYPFIYNYNIQSNLQIQYNP